MASSRVCLVAAGFGCQVLGYHAHRVTEAFGSLIGSGTALPAAVRLPEVVSGQAASCTAEPLLITLCQLLPNLVQEIHFGCCGYYFAFVLYCTCKIVSHKKWHCTKNLYFQVQVCFQQALRKYFRRCSMLKYLPIRKKLLPEISYIYAMNCRKIEHSQQLEVYFIIPALGCLPICW